MGILQIDTKQEGKMKLLPKKPKQTNSDSNTSVFPEELFSDYNLDTSWEEALWMLTVPEQSMMNTPKPMMEEENNFNSVWDFNVEVNDVSAAPSEAYFIAENNNESETYPFKKEEAEDLDDCWGLGSFHAPATMVEGINLENNNKVTEKDAAEIDSIYNMDIVQFALGESGLDEFLSEEKAQDSTIVEDDVDAFSVISMQEQISVQPVATTTSFIDHTNTFLTIDPSAMSQLLPNIKAETAVSNQSKPVLKRKAGRPERQTPLEITEIPKNGSVCLTEDQMRSLKYRRSRELNNEASKRCRKNRKEKLNIKEQKCDELKEKNRMLAEQMLAKEAEVVVWRARCRSIGYHIY